MNPRRGRYPHKVTGLGTRGVQRLGLKGTVSGLPCTKRQMPWQQLSVVTSTTCRGGLNPSRSKRSLQPNALHPSPGDPPQAREALLRAAVQTVKYCLNLWGSHEFTFDVQIEQ